MQTLEDASAEITSSSTAIRGSHAQLFSRSSQYRTNNQSHPNSKTPMCPRPKSRIQQQPLLPRPSIAKLSTLSIPKRIALARRKPRGRLEETAGILRSVALAIGEEEAASFARVLRVPGAAGQLLTLVAASHGIGDGDLVGGRWRTAAGVIDLGNALVAVGAVDDVVAAAGGVDGGRGLDGGDGLNDRVGGDGGGGRGLGDSRGGGGSGASWSGEGGGCLCRRGGGLWKVSALFVPLT